MTAATRARRPHTLAQHTTDYVAHLRGKLRSHLHDAETAEVAFRARHALIVRSYTDRAKRLVELRDDMDLADAGRTVTYHRQMAGMYAAALTGELAATQLLARHRHTAGGGGDR